MIDDALQEFHNHKDSIISAGARTGKGGRIIDNWHIPKLEFMQSVTASIRDSGVPMQWSADHTERCHITEIKVPSRSGNRQDYESQICRYLDRIEKCRLFNLATTIRDVEVNVSSLWSDDDDSQNGDNDDDEGLLKDPQQATHSESSRPTKHANYFELAESLERGMHPAAPHPYRTIVRGRTALHISRDPNMKLSVDEAMKKFNLPDLCGALADFLSHSNYEDSSVIGGRRMAAVDTQLPFDELQIWTKIQLQNHSYHAPHNILPPQAVNASPPSGTWTFGRSDIILFNVDPSKVWPQSGIEGVCFLECLKVCYKFVSGHHVAQLRIVFRVVPCRRAPYHPCADLILTYAQRFDVIPQPCPQSPEQKGLYVEPSTKMFLMKSARRSDRSIMGGILPLGQVRALVNLVPLFGEVADNRLTKETLLEYGSEFRLNPYFDKELYYALCRL